MLFPDSSHTAGRLAEIEALEKRFARRKMAEELIEVLRNWADPGTYPEHGREFCRGWNFCLDDVMHLIRRKGGLE